MKNAGVRSILIFLALSVFLTGYGLAGLPQSAQQVPQPPPMTVEQVRGNLYLVKGGSGANTGFYVTSKGVAVIDAKMTPEAAGQMLDEIKKITPQPVKWVILTHSDGDHINGLPGFPEGLEIIAHDEAKKDIEKAAADMPALKPYLPAKTYGKSLSLPFGNQPVDLLNFGPAHTSGDTVVYFHDEKAAFVGDLAFVGRDPLIHRHKNGSAAGLIMTLRAILDIQPPVEVFLSGHADKMTRADVETLLKSVEEKQSKVKALIAEGKSLEEVKQTFNVQDRPAQPGRPRWLSLVEVIYLELTEKK